MSNSANIITAALDEQGRIADDLPCRECAYNLRAQTLDGNCPECGAAVIGSARGHYLRHASPDWVKKLARGTLLVIIAGAAWVLGTILAYAGVFAYVLLASASPGPTGFPVGLIVLIVLGAVLALAIIVTLIIGLLRMTTPDPASRARPEGRTARRAVRICLCATAATVIGVVIAAMLTNALGSWRMGAVISGIVGIASLVAWVVLPLALVRHMGALMQRIPRPGLVKFARIEFWGVLATGGLGVIGFVTIILGSARMVAAMPLTTPTSAPTSAPTSGPIVFQQSVTVQSAGGPAIFTTTMPATTMPAFAGPPMTGSLLAAMIALRFGNCVGLGFGIAGFVLLILVQRALSTAAREAASNAAA